MKALIQRTATDCVSVAMKTRDIQTVGEESVLFLNLYEAQNLVDSLQIALMPSEKEALDMLPEVILADVAEMEYKAGQEV